MRSPFLSGASLAIFGALALWSCGGTTPAAPTPAPGPSPGPGPVTVTVNIVGSMGNQAYRPNPVAANAGDTILFRNNDTWMHHVVLPTTDRLISAMSVQAPPAGASRSETPTR